LAAGHPIVGNLLSGMAHGFEEEERQLAAVWAHMKMCAFFLSAPIMTAPDDLGRCITICTVFHFLAGLGGRLASQSPQGIF
jgi:hypothetical protein